MRAPGRRGDGGQEKEHGLTRTKNGERSGRGGVSQCLSGLPSVWVAKGTLSLLNLCIYLLGRQLASQAAAFEKEGGFTERLYRERSRSRQDKGA